MDLDTPTAEWAIQNACPMTIAGNAGLIPLESKTMKPHRRILSLVFVVATICVQPACVREVHEYPAGWVSQASAEATHCPDVSGTYVNRAETVIYSERETLPSPPTYRGTRGEPPPGSGSVDRDSQDDTRVESNDKGAVRQRNTSCGGSSACFLWTLLSTDYDKTYSGGPGPISSFESALVELAQNGDGNLSVRLIKHGEIVDNYTREVGRNGLRCGGSGYRWSYNFPVIEELGLGVGHESFSLSLDVDGSLVAERRMTIGAAAMLVIPVGGQENQWYRWARHDGS